MQIVSDLTTLPKALVPDEGTNDLEGHFCIQTIPYFCNCRPRPWTFIHHGKKIIVWKEKDDENLLAMASEFKKIQLDPHIIEYKVMMGKAILWDDIPNGVTIG